MMMFRPALQSMMARGFAARAAYNSNPKARQPVRQVYKPASPLDKFKLNVDDVQSVPFEKIEGLSKETAVMFKERGFENAFPVQAASFRPVYEGDNIIVKEKTGSGKTIAYALPIIERLRKQKKLGDYTSKGPKVIVLVPTRELCMQVYGEIDKLQISAGEFSTVPVFGGVNFGSQAQNLRRGSDLVVATPGRLADHIDKQSIDLSNVEAIIMDETDEMLNIGFKVQIQEIIETIKSSSGGSKDIQFLLFSATIPDWVSKDAVSFMGNNFKFIDMVSSSSQETPMNTQHIKLLVQNTDEAKGLISTLINKYAKNRGRCIVFTETKYEAKDLAKNNQIIGDVR